MVMGAKKKKIQIHVCGGDAADGGWTGVSESPERKQAKKNHRWGGWSPIWSWDGWCLMRIPPEVKTNSGRRVTLKSRLLTEWSAVSWRAPETSSNPVQYTTRSLVKHS